MTLEVIAKKWAFKKNTWKNRFLNKNPPDMFVYSFCQEPTVETKVTNNHNVYVLKPAKRQLKGILI